MRQEREAGYEMIRVKDWGHQSQESSHTHSSKETLLFLSLLSLDPCIGKSKYPAKGSSMILSPVLCHSFRLHLLLSKKDFLFSLLVSLVSRVFFFLTLCSPSL